MGQLYSLDGHRGKIRRRQRVTYFSRSELNKLLSLYSRRVISGEWRDYAIDQKGGSAVFSVFRHSQDAPVFRIAKRAAGGAPGSAPGSAPGDAPESTSGSAAHREYLVLSGRETLKQAASMREALSVFGRHLTVVR